MMCNDRFCFDRQEVGCFLPSLLLQVVLGGYIFLWGFLLWSLFLCSYLGLEEVPGVIF